MTPKKSTSSAAQTQQHSPLELWSLHWVLSWKDIKLKEEKNKERGKKAEIKNKSHRIWWWLWLLLVFQSSTGNTCGHTHLTHQCTSQGQIDGQTDGWRGERWLNRFGGNPLLCPVHWQPRLCFSSVSFLKMVTEQLQIKHQSGDHPLHQTCCLPIQTNKTIKTNQESQTTGEGIDCSCGWRNWGRFGAEKCYCDIHCKNTACQVKYGNNKVFLRGFTHTCLCRALIDLVGECADAFIGNGSQREGVVGIGAQTLHHIWCSGLKIPLFLFV